MLTILHDLGDSIAKRDLSAMFATTSSFVFPASLSLWSGFLGVQFLDVLQALLLNDFSSIILFLCASLGPGPGASCCVLQRHIFHSLVCEDPPSVLRFQRPSEGYDSRDRSLWLFLDVLTTSFTVQSYLNAVLRCAAYFSRVSACWLYS